MESNLVPLFGKPKFDEDISKRYELKNVLGEGAFSKVYLAVDKKSGDKYAAKVMQRDDIIDKMESLGNEVRILQSIKHPNIVGLHQLWETRQAVYLVMELVTGGELFDRIIERGTYSEKDAAHLMKQILEAVRYIHSMEVVHRDLKPENLLYSSSAEDANIMLTDFGLATIEEDGKMNDACGTPGYVAPEVLRRENYGKPVDCWAIGVINYILLCGYPPFYDPDDNDNVIFSQIVQGQYQFDSPYWDDISDQAKQFIRSLMAMNQKQRFTCEIALQHPWICGEAPDVDIHQSVAEQIRKNFARKKWKQALNAVGAIRKMQALRL